MQGAKKGMTPRAMHTDILWTHCYGNDDLKNGKS